ncbi:hypothetical protein RchiOBHm_Chr2g0133811 [Rosa chinensis]|uniref:Uncharacterized protein n=1 Tax=Rosa chinensis TaxID=74649 RepID=A0A2P6RVP4_ROSCH|nr:hypothetical protein RchiOBHm_Chr2g0133811 [Rosa chinensis]
MAFQEIQTEIFLLSIPCHAAFPYSLSLSPSISPITAPNTLDSSLQHFFIFVFLILGSPQIEIQAQNSQAAPIDRIPPPPLSRH